MSKKFGKSCIGMLAVGLAFLIGCTSSGSPSTPTIDDDTLSSDSGDIEGQNNPRSSSAKTIPGTIVGQSSSSPASPPFDISTLPGSYTPSGNVSYSISGKAAFGPYQTGATVSVYGFDATSGKKSPTAVNSSVSDNLGGFSSQGSITSNYASIEVSGAYYNIQTMDKGNMTLKALADMRSKTTVNVNILTRLAYDRTVYLIAKESKSFEEAKAQAEKEVLASFALLDDDTPFEEITLNTKGQAGANLIIATFVLTANNDMARTATIIDAIAADIASDGHWDDMTIKTEVADAFYYVDLSTMMGKLQRAIKTDDLKVSDLGPVNFYGVVNGMGPCNDETDGTVAVNSNTLSKQYQMTFECRDSSWYEVSGIVAFSNQVTKVLGECNSSKDGSIETYNGSEVVCKGGYWQVMTEADKQSAVVAKAKGACTSSNNLAVVEYESAYYQCLNSTWTKLSKTPVDYSKGRAMNKKLGRGINFGNSWDAEGAGSNDGGWSNPIQDNWFGIVKSAGFNSIRLPVRWEQDANANGGSISSARMNAVKADVDLAIKQGLTVIIDAHHHNTLNDAAANYSSNASKYNSEKQKFLNMWKQIASTFSSYSSNVVLEILNEPHDVAMAQVNDLMTSAYQVIRQNAPNSTIMFESAGYSKFAQIPNLNLPNDGNIIVSGHYYDPYNFTHQNHGYSYNASATFSATTIANDFKSYANAIAKAFPDKNGGCVPINMGEFGVNSRSNSGVTDSKRAPWIDAVISAAEQYGFSWHYWAFSNSGGFEVYSGSWDSNAKTVFDKYLSKASAVK